MGKYRIFLSSPEDVLPERDRAEAVVDRLNAEHAGGSLFSLTRWEQSYYSASATFQQQIASLRDHDIVVFIFWKRLGTDLPPAYNRPDGTTRTGTEYEFEEAKDARETRVDQLPDILVYRKTAKVLFSEETVDVERAQKKALDQFWERWFRTSAGHFIAGFQSFPGTQEFDVQFESNLREWLKRRRSEQIVWDIARQGSPYRGLAAYDESHAGQFFGRELDISRARARFIEAGIGQESGRRGTPFLLILGASGCGKSSLLRAGLLPRLRTGGVPAFREDGSDGIRAFRSIVVVPREMGADLCAGLAAALYATGPSTGCAIGLPELADGDFRTPAEFAELVMTSPDAAASSIVRALDRIASAAGSGTAASPDRWGLLLAIDQLEELFSRPDLDRRALTCLLTVLARTGRVWLVATMRNDFYDRLRLDPDLSTLSDQGRTYDLTPPNIADFRAIIRQPAAAAGLVFETAGPRDLAAEIEAEAGGDGALPMVAFLLERLFQERRGSTLTLETYDRLGGTAGALASYGEGVIAALGQDVRNSFQRIVRHLVRKGLQDIAATATAAPLAVFTPGGHERALIDALGEARLLRTFSVATGAGPTVAGWVRWSHEALLTRWPRLRLMIDIDRRDYETLDRLATACSLWETTPADRKTERLLTDLALAEGVDLIERWGPDVDEPLQRFVTTSRAHARSRRQRRRRMVVAIVAALSALAIIATGAAIAALHQRDSARQAEQTAEQTMGFLVDLFLISDPSEARGGSITAREVLDKGAARLAKQLAGQPAIQARLMDTVGSVYMGLGLYRQARPLLDKSIEISRASAATSPLTLAETLNHEGELLTRQAEFGPAEKVFREAIALPQPRPAVRAFMIARAKSVHGLGIVLAQQGVMQDAERSLRNALAQQRSLYPAGHDDVAASLQDLSKVVEKNGDLPKAIALMGEAVAMNRALHGTEPYPAFAETINDLGYLREQNGEHAAAEKLFLEALGMKRRLFGPKHPEVAAGLANLALTLNNAGDLERAESLYREALAMQRELLGELHPDVADTLNNLAFLQYDRGRTDEALRTEREALHVYRQLFPSDHPEVARIENRIGYWLTQAGAYAEADHDLREALAMRKRLFGASHPDVASSLTHLAILEVATGHSAEALESARAARTIYEATSTADWKAAIAESAEGGALLGLGRLAEAEVHLTHGVTALSKKDADAPLTYRRVAEGYLQALRKRQAKVPRAVSAAR